MQMIIISVKETKMKRYSRKREAILEAIRSTKSHPSAEWVYAKLKPEFPDLSLATVYRNLAAFVESGELVSVAVVDSKERYDADLSSHAHFICQQCGDVSDVDIHGSRELDKLASEYLGAKVERHELIFRGICHNCCENSDIAG